MPFQVVQNTHKLKSDYFSDLKASKNLALAHSGGKMDLSGYLSCLMTGKTREIEQKLNINLFPLTVTTVSMNLKVI